MAEIAAEEGATVELDALLGAIEEGASASAAPASSRRPQPQRQRVLELAKKSKLLCRKVGESVTEADIGEWLKKEGDAVALDEAIVSLETD